MDEGESDHAIAHAMKIQERRDYFAAKAMAALIPTTNEAAECLDVSKLEMQDFWVPANPLDKQTPEYLAKWFADRLWFRCDYRQDIVTEKWTFCRPQHPISTKVD